MKDPKSEYDGVGISERIIELGRENPELVDKLSPLKLQKILFYAQGWYAANTDQRLFIDDIYAWQYGPVVVDVYNHYKSAGALDLLKKESFSIDEDSNNVDNKDIDDFLSQLLGVYGNLSAYELVARTHKEDVWIRNYRASNKLIPFEEIRKEFKLKLVGA